MRVEFLNHFSYDIEPPKGAVSVPNLSRFAPSGTAYFVVGQIQYIDPFCTTLFGQGNFVQIQGDWNVSNSQDLVFKSHQVLQAGDQVFIPVVNEDGRWAVERNKNGGLLAPSFNEWKSRFQTKSKIYLWPMFLQRVREFFYKNDFIEVPTPSLVENPGMEIHLQPFVTHWNLGSRKTKFYLPTSPEIHLKKHLCLGWNQIFEIKSCYRDQEISSIHQPEFLLLEWYRSFASLEAIQLDIKNLFIDITNFFKGEMELPEFVGLNISDLLEKSTGKKMPVEGDHASMLNFVHLLGLQADPNDNWDELFNQIMVEVIEPHIKKINSAVFVSGYPRSHAALAKVNKKGEAQRFELYWKGVELANAFYELNDPFEQRARLEGEQKQREKMKSEVPSLDEEFLNALESSMPPTSGIAMGLERLFMVCSGLNSLNDFLPFAKKT